MTKLIQLEADLRVARRLWQYESRIEGKFLNDAQKVAVAQRVLAAGKSWAQGLAEEFAARKYPPGYPHDEGQ